MSETVEQVAGRLMELEVRYTHQQDTIETLSDALYEQQRALRALTARVAALEGRGSAGGGSEPARDPEAERPPHY